MSYTRKTTIEQHTGNHHATGLPMVRLHDVITTESYYLDADDEGPEDRDWWEGVIDDLHEAEVELASLPVDLRRMATHLLEDMSTGDVEDEPARIRKAIAAVRDVGAPTKSPDGSAATARIELRVTPAQKDRIRKLADKAGLSVTDYVLGKVL